MLFKPFLICFPETTDTLIHSKFNTFIQSYATYRHNPGDVCRNTNRHFFITDIRNSDKNWQDDSKINWK